MKIWERIRRFWSGDGLRRDLDEEMDFHVEELTRDLIEEGMDPRQARREAVRRFGNRERVQERMRRVRGFGLLDESSRNLRFAIRGLTRDPVFAATFVLTLGLTVGLGTLAFGIGDSTLWRALPYGNADQLVRVVLYDVERGIDPQLQSVDAVTWERFRDRGAPIEAAVYSSWGSGVNLDTDGAAAYVIQQRVGAGYFETLGVAPARGRGFTASEDVPGGPAVAILSHGLWSTTFGSDPAILGSTVRLKGEAHRVVGVMPEDFRSPAEADVWTPLRPTAAGEGSGTNYAVVGRLPTGMSVDEGRARVATITLPESWAARDQEYRYGLIPLDESLASGSRTPVLILVVGIGMMLLVGWANLAGLQIGRTLGRREELATRRALGSGRAPLVRQMLVENLLLAVLGGGLGLGFAVLLGPPIEAIVQSRLGAWRPLPGPGTTSLVVLGLTFLAMIVFATVPLLRAARPGLSRIVVAGSRVVGRDRHLGRKALLVGQVATVAVLLFGAGLLVRSHAHLDGLDPGFDPEGVTAVRYSLDDTRFADAETVHALFRESLQELERIPGVESAAVSLTLPYERPLNMPFVYPGDDQTQLTNAAYVTDDFFETLRIPLLAGRTFDARDASDAPMTMVVNQAFVDEYLEGRDPLTARLEFRNQFGEVSIIGVVGNVQQSAGWGDTSQPVWETPTVYWRAQQMPAGFLQAIHVWFAPNWIVRRAETADPLAGPVTAAFRRIAPDLPVSRNAPVSEIVGGAFAQQRFEAMFLLALAGLSLVLAAIGLYGIVSQEVLERRGEMGIRMALGASPGRAVWHTAAGGMALAGTGLLIGSAVAFFTRGVLQNLIWGIGTLDPVVIVGMVGVLGLLTAGASLIPAARIGRMDPARVLREE